MQSYKHGMASQGPDPELYYVKQNRIGTSIFFFTHALSERLPLSSLPVPAGGALALPGAAPVAIHVVCYVA